MNILEKLIVGPGIGGDPSSSTNTMLHPLGAMYDRFSGNQAQRKEDEAKKLSEAADAAKELKYVNARNLSNSTGLTFKKGGKVSSASSRADGCAVRGRTRA